MGGDRRRFAWGELRAHSGNRVTRDGSTNQRAPSLRSRPYFDGAHMIEVAVFEDALGLHIEVRDDENERGLATTIATEVLNDPQVEGDHLIAAAVAYLTWLLFLMLEAF